MLTREHSLLRLPFIGVRRLALPSRALATPPPPTPNPSDAKHAKLALAAHLQQVRPDVTRDAYRRRRHSVRAGVAESIEAVIVDNGAATKRRRRKERKGRPAVSPALPSMQSLLNLPHT